MKVKKKLKLKRRGKNTRYLKLLCIYCLALWQTTVGRKKEKICN